VAEGGFGHHFLKSGPILAARGRLCEILIDNGDQVARPTQTDGALLQGTLSALAFQVV
jgi:hypothetical protein